MKEKLCTHYVHPIYENKTSVHPVRPRKMHINRLRLLSFWLLCRGKKYTLARVTRADRLFATQTKQAILIKLVLCVRGTIDA